MAIIFFTVNHQPITLDYTFEELVEWYAEKFEVSLLVAAAHLQNKTTLLTLPLPVGPRGAVVSRTGVIRILEPCPVAN